MSRRPNQRGPIFRVIAVVSLTIIIVLVLLSATGRLPLSGPMGLLNRVTSPIVDNTSRLFDNIEEWLINRQYMTDLEENYVVLLEESREMQSELQHMNELKKELLRLELALAYTETMPETEHVLARVVARDVNTWDSEFIINRGENHGVRKNAAVVTHQGLAGYVVEAWSTRARVRSIVDSRSAAAGVIERTRDTGIIRGNIALDPTEPCHMVFLPLDAALVPGDLVLTSGHEQIFPKGLLIGIVSHVSSQPGGTSYAVLQPTVDLHRLVEVLVVTNYSPIAGDEPTTAPLPTPSPTQGTPP